jgi:hypothetical protein
MQRIREDGFSGLTDPWRMANVPVCLAGNGDDGSLIKRQLLRPFLFASARLYAEAVIGVEGETLNLLTVIDWKSVRPAAICL